jgi:hypothetical protein
MKRLFALPVLLPLSAASAGPERYQVDAQVHIDGRLIGTPRLLVNEGVAGTVEMAGLEGYRFVASVSRDARTGRYHLRTEIAQPTAAAGHLLAAPPARHRRTGRPGALQPRGASPLSYPLRSGPLIPPRPCPPPDRSS